MTNYRLHHLRDLVHLEVAPDFPTASLTLFLFKERKDPGAGHQSTYRFRVDRRSALQLAFRFGCTERRTLAANPIAARDVDFISDLV